MPSPKKDNPLLSEEFRDFCLQQLSGRSISAFSRMWEQWEWFAGTDYSYRELGEAFGTSRQSVHQNVRKIKHLYEEFTKKGGSI